MTDRLEQLEKMHAADPGDPFCTYGIAMEHAKSGRLDDAIEWLDKTIDADGQYCYAYYQKAKLLSEKGEQEAGRDVLHKGMESARAAGEGHAAEEMGELLENI